MRHLTGDSTNDILLKATEGANEIELRTNGPSTNLGSTSNSIAATSFSLAEGLGSTITSAFAHTEGFMNTTSLSDSYVGGFGAGSPPTTSGDLTGAFIRANGFDSSIGDIEFLRFNGRAEVTSGPIVPAMGAVNLGKFNNQTVSIKAWTIARRTAGSGTSGDSKFFKHEVLAKWTGTGDFDGTIIGNTTTTIAQSAGASSWTAVIGFSFIEDILQAQFLGEINSTIRFVTTANYTIINI